MRMAKKIRNGDGRDSQAPEGGEAAGRWIMWTMSWEELREEMEVALAKTEA